MSSCASRSRRSCWAALATGARLPAIRRLKDLGLAGGTVARAYRELEADGVVTTYGRYGTVIAGPPHHPGPPPELLDAARNYATRASRTGASLDDALTAVRVALAAAAGAHRRPSRVDAMNAYEPGG